MEIHFKASTELELQSCMGPSRIYLIPSCKYIRCKAHSVKHFMNYPSPLSTCILYGCLQRVMIPEAVVIQLVLLRMSSMLPKTC